jgi:hypothetical protein
VDFVVDTGAMVTALSPLDAASPVGIDPSKLAELLPYATPSSIRGVGGEIQTFETPAVYGFLHDDGNVQIVNGQIVAVPLTEKTAPLPSLLGWDILQQFQLTTNYRTQTVTLE